MSTPVPVITSPTLVLRIPKGTELTYTETDTNFYNLKNAIMSVSGSLNTFSTQAASELNSALSSVSNIQSALNAEISIRQSETSSIQGDLTQEILDRQAADVTIQNAISSETTARQNADTAINGTLSTIGTRLTTAEGNITSQGSRITVLESTISQIGSAFSYVGHITAGSQSTPFNLNTLPKKTAGSYYAVDSTGYVTYNSVVKHVTINDGIVFNDENGYTVIDNSKTSVSGTTDFISVTGDETVGYQVDIGSAFKTRVTDLETNSLEYFGQVEGGVDASHPFMLNGAEGFRDKAVYRVDSSGWFGVSGQLLTTFAAFGDLIVIDGNYFQVLKTSSIKMTGSSDISVIRNSDESGQDGFTHNRGWSVDLGQTFKDRIDSIETNANQVTSIDARVTTLETVVTAPLVYRGTLSGGTQLAPTDISTTVLVAVGDYYKVIVGGYFTDLEKTFYANANDSIIFRAQGITDLIDNTDPVTTGTTDYIAVTGNTDEGFVIDIDSSFKTTVSNLGTRVTALENAGGMGGPGGGVLVTLTTTTTDPDQVLDSVVAADYSVVRYIAHCTDGTDIRVSEILMTYNGTTTYITEYGKILSTTGNEIASFSCDIDSGNFRLLVTPVAANTVFKLTRTGF